MDDLFSFEWGRDPAGYALKRMPESRGRKLPGRSSELLLGGGEFPAGEEFVERKGSSLKTYPPRAIPALHRVFAALPDEPQAVLDFVCVHGFLGVSGRPATEIERESIKTILGCRDELRGVLDYLDTTFSFERKLRRIASEMREEGGTPKLDIGEVRQMAAGLFNQWAAAHLQHVQVSLTNTRDHRKRASVALQVRPRTLLSALWLAAAEEITGGNKWRPCAVCGKPMSIGEGGGRRDKRTCSTACRKKLNRRDTEETEK
jgi:hypothetical protein